MQSRITRTLASVFVVFLLTSGIWAQSSDSSVSSRLDPKTKTLTITIKGTIGPILSGSDPLGLDGLSAKVTILASESLSPISHTATSATYKLPAGAISVTAGSNKFKNKSPAKMTIALTKTADTMTLALTGPDGIVITDATFLKVGSWTTAVLKHPTTFSPTPQRLTAAKTAGGPGCKVKYVVEGSTTVLGFKGTAGNSDAVDPVLPDPTLSEEYWEQ
jgi:hypothetical protein